MNQYLDDNLGFNIMRSTETAALTASRWVGRGVVEEADQAAAQTMRHSLDRLRIAGHIVIGERPTNVDPAILGSGITVGQGADMETDVIVDSIEGVHLMAEGLPDAISVVAVAPRGSMQYAIPTPYMQKLVVGAEAAQVLRPEALDAPVAWTLGIIAPALGKAVRDLTVFVLKRDRHRTLIEDIRATGARVIIRSEGDVVGALLAALPESGIDVLMGIGGSSQGVVGACAVKALGGALLARLSPRNPEEHAAMKSASLAVSHIFTQDELVTSDDIFFSATGVTDGLLLQGVRYHSAGATTHSLVLRGRTHTRRQIDTYHDKDHLIDF